jgi:hypothetical protein
MSGMSNSVLPPTEQPLQVKILYLFDIYKKNGNY